MKSKTQEAPVRLTFSPDGIKHLLTVDIEKRYKDMVVTSVRLETGDGRIRWIVDLVPFAMYPAGA